MFAALPVLRPDFAHSASAALVASFTAYLLVLLPMAAVTSSRRLRRRGEPGSAPSPAGPLRRQIVVGTLLNLAVVAVFAWVVADRTWFDPFAIGALGAREIGLGAAALATCLLARAVHVRTVRSEVRRRSPLLIAVPRNGTEWAIAIFVCVLAGFSEELAYRGVLVHVLEPRTGHLGAALLSAVAFAAAHAVQGVRTMVTILVIALVLQLLVDATHTLVVAMVVHASYDVVAKVLFARFARREGLLEAA